MASDSQAGLGWRGLHTLCAAQQVGPCDRKRGTNTGFAFSEQSRWICLSGLFPVWKLRDETHDLTAVEEMCPQQQKATSCQWQHKLIFFLKVNTPSDNNTDFKMTVIQQPLW